MSINGNDASQLNAHPCLRDIYLYNLSSLSWLFCSFQSLEKLTICPKGSSLWMIPFYPLFLIYAYYKIGCLYEDFDLT